MLGYAAVHQAVNNIAKAVHIQGCNKALGQALTASEKLMGWSGKRRCEHKHDLPSQLS